MTSLQYYTYTILVSFPDPTLKEGKGLVYIEHFLGLESDLRHVVYMW